MKKNNNFLDYIPALSENITWTDDNNIVTIHITHRGVYAWIAQKLFTKPKQSHIKLDEYGSFIWLSIDGNNTVFDIAKALESKYGNEVEPLYERLVYYLRILKNNNFIVYNKEHLK